MKYIDYELTPEVFHILPPGSDGREKSETAPARLVFIADDGTRTYVAVGSVEAARLMEEVKKNNPEPHNAVSSEVLSEEQKQEDPSTEKPKKGRKSKIVEG